MWLFALLFLSLAPYECLSSGVLSVEDFQRTSLLIGDIHHTIKLFGCRVGIP